MHTSSVWSEHLEAREVRPVAARVPREKRISGHRGVGADVKVWQRRAPGTTAAAIREERVARQEGGLPRQLELLVVVPQCPVEVFQPCVRGRKLSEHDRVDGEDATLKRFYKEKDRFRLEPANSKMKPIISKNVEVLGVVVGVVRQFK